MPRTFIATAADAITRARYITQDTVPDHRTTDTEALLWVNDALNTMVAVVPGLFAKQGTHTCVAGYRQPIINDRAVSVEGVIGVPACDLETLTQFMPGWQTATAGTIKNWMRGQGSPLLFYCYPPSSAGQALSIEYIESPAPLVSVDDLLPVPENLIPAITDYLVGMIEAKDDEHVDSNRQQAALAQFSARLKGA